MTGVSGLEPPIFYSVGITLGTTTRTQILNLPYKQQAQLKPFAKGNTTQY